MIARLWKTGLVPDGVAEYEAFARDLSLAMFRAQDGFLGCVMSRRSDEGQVLTLWRDLAAVESLRNSKTYIATVERLLSTGVLAGAQSTDIADVHLLDLDRIRPPAALT